MIGHQQIIDVRKRGKKPECIFVEFDSQPCNPRFEYQHPERQIAWGLSPFVYVATDERPDLRFLIGCRVLVSAAEWTDEYLAFLDRLTGAKPSKIIANAFSQDGNAMIWNESWEVVQCQS